MLTSTNSQIVLKNISQVFTTQQHQVVLFQDVNMVFKQGESYAIMGPSGSGKSSLLMVASGLENATHGDVVYQRNGQSSTLQALREDIGYIFQHFHLLPELDALNNVALPLKLRGVKSALAKAKVLLEKVGLGDRVAHKPSQLSGGEQQRVAIARALVFEPKFIFADEPTGNLDAESANAITDLLFSCCREKGAGLVLVTHSQVLANNAQNSLRFSQGKCVFTKNKVLKDCNVQ